MISKDQIYIKIKELCNISELQDESQSINLVEDLGFESIQIVKLIIDIEKEYDITFDIFQINIEDFTCLDNLVKKIYNLILEK